MENFLTNTKNLNNIKNHINALVSTGNFHVIERFIPKKHYAVDDKNIDKKIGVFLDVETTGLALESDQIIELAMVPFEFDSSGQIYTVMPAYNSFNDPQIPISQEIMNLTGITNDMVKGQKIDLNSIHNMLEKAVLVIAHNAAFDRPFCEKLTEKFQDISWGCSIADIPWQSEGIHSAKLEYLAYKYGFFYEGHRATIDCQIGIELLSRTLPKTNESVFKVLLNNARKSTVRIWAEDAPYEYKDNLKKRGYRWSSGESGTRKSWYIDLPEDQFQSELIRLSKDIYHRDCNHLPIEHFNAKKRYSSRV